MKGPAPSTLAECARIRQVDRIAIPLIYAGWEIQPAYQKSFDLIPAVNKSRVFGF